MSFSEQYYRKQARNCRDLASGTVDRKERAALLQLASHYDGQCRTPT